MRKRSAMPRVKSVERSSSLEKASRKPTSERYKIEMDIQFVCTISPLNFSLNSPKPSGFAQLTITVITSIAAMDIMEVTNEDMVRLPALNLKQMAEAQEILKQLNKTRVRKNYFSSLLAIEYSFLLQDSVIFEIMYKTMPTRISTNISKNMALKLSRKEGQNLISFTRWGSSQEDEPRMGTEKPLSYFIFIRGERRTLTESMLPTLKQANCRTPNSQRPIILPGIIVRKRVAQLAISRTLYPFSKAYFSAHIPSSRKLAGTLLFGLTSTKEGVKMKVWLGQPSISVAFSMRVNILRSMSSVKSQERLRVVWSKVQAGWTRAAEFISIRFGNEIWSRTEQYGAILNENCRELQYFRSLSRRYNETTTSSLHKELHESPLMRFPSSQGSKPFWTPSPQTVWQTVVKLANMVQLKNGQSVQELEQPSPLAVFPSSQPSSPLAVRPSPQIDVQS